MRSRGTILRSSFGAQRSLRTATARATGAFSLVELLVAVGLLAVIMVALMMAFQQVQRAMHLGLNQVDVLENGRAIMNLISRDMQEITFSEVPDGTNFYAKPLNPPQKLFSTNWDSALDELFFLIQTNNQWLSIKYTFQEEHVVNGYHVAALYRKMNPPTTNYFPVTNVLSVCTTNVWESTGLDNAFNPNFHRVADGIVHFKVQALNINGEPYDVTNSTDTMTIIGNPNGYQTYSFAHTNLPAFIEIEMGLVEPQTLKAFDSRLSVDPETAKNYLLQRPGKVHLFRQRIAVRSHHRTDS